ncbi:MAG: hypothetical protein ACYS99_20275 [Planctomycetota bacterium]|jgi:hypothetical protein
MTLGRAIPLLMLAALLPLLGGCVIRHGDFTVLSNKLVRTSDFELSKADRVKDVEGVDVAHIIIFIPTKGQVLLEEAIDDALRKGRGDVMTDAVITFTSYYFLLYGQSKWTVRGDVVKTRRN